MTGADVRQLAVVPLPDWPLVVSGYDEVTGYSWSLRPEYEALEGAARMAVTEARDADADARSCDSCTATGVGIVLRDYEDDNGRESEREEWAYTVAVSDGVRAWLLCEDCADSVDPGSVPVPVVAT